MPTCTIGPSIRKLGIWLAKHVNRVFKALLRPASAAPLVNTLLDLPRPKQDLIAENALLRHQRALVLRQSKPPRLKSSDRLKLLLLARMTKSWRQVLLISNLTRFCGGTARVSPVHARQTAPAQKPDAILSRDH